MQGMADVGILCRGKSVQIIFSQTKDCLGLLNKGSTTHQGSSHQVFYSSSPDPGPGAPKSGGRQKLLLLLYARQNYYYTADTAGTLVTIFARGQRGVAHLHGYNTKSNAGPCKAFSFAWGTKSNAGPCLVDLLTPVDFRKV